MWQVGVFRGYGELFFLKTGPDSKFHGANMGPIWGRQDPGGPHVGPMNFVIWDSSQASNPFNDIDYL